MIDIDIQDETNELSDEQIQLVENILNEAASFEKVSKGTEISVTFVDDEAIREINRQYRDKDQVTDVISFALNDYDEDETELVIDEAIPNLLGDIIVSYPRLLEQAEEYQHSVDRELGFLVLHGFLHLLGYDHMTEEEEKIMFKKQEDILMAYGLQK
ncbi:rRNA maturation RNase YbeY [Bacillaceae bacterium IKA-2]|jgi:probable rRNA maturation factor|nr:rRNA maturation RNase YbeY [Bacillaceae bacterium IKA-2]